MRNTKHEDLKDRVNVESGFFIEMVNASIAAAIVGVSLRSWFRFVSEGKAPQPVRIGGCVRWRLNELRDWISNGCESVALKEGDQQ